MPRKRSERATMCAGAHDSLSSLRRYNDFSSALCERVTRAIREDDCGAISVTGRGRKGGSLASKMAAENGGCEPSY